MATKRIGLLVLLATVLGLTLSVGVSFGQVFNWFTLRVVSSRAILDMTGRPSSFTAYHIQDSTGKQPGCFLIIRDSATGFFTTTEVHGSSCGWDVQE